MSEREASHRVVLIGGSPKVLRDLAQLCGATPVEWESLLDAMGDYRPSVMVLGSEVAAHLENLERPPDLSDTSVFEIRAPLAPPLEFPTAAANTATEVRRQRELMLGRWPGGSPRRKGRGKNL